MTQRYYIKTRGAELSIDIFGQDSQSLSRITDVDGHMTRRSYLIGLFKIRADSADGNVRTIFTTPISPSCTVHRGIISHSLSIK